MLPQSERPRSAGLRERKKARTRTEIQKHALRLFQAQGYENTTVEQIAEAAEVSPSTFFRYFPTKEEVVLWDALDPLLIPAFEAQSEEMDPIPALRNAFRTVFAEVTAEERAQQWERTRLILSVPDLRMRMLGQFVEISNLLAELVAKRVGRRANDLMVRSFAGALTGVLLAMLFAGNEDPEADYGELLDIGLAHLDAGLPL